MNTSEQINELAAALIKVQATIKPPKKEHEGQARGGRYHYADLADVIEAAREPMADNDLALVQAPSMNSDGFALVSRLIHTSGQWVESVYPLPIGVGSQEMGSAITYGRRYSLCALLGIAAEDDDDGAAATTPARQALSTPATRPASPPANANGAALCPTHRKPFVHRVGTSKTTGKPYDFWPCPVQGCKERKPAETKPKATTKQLTPEEMFPPEDDQAYLDKLAEEAEQAT